MRVAILVALLLFVPPAFGQPTGARSNVLIVFDEDKDFPGLMAVNQSLQEGFRGQLQDVDFFTESLNLSRFAHAGYDVELRDHFRRKYADKRVDLIVAVMAPSLEFLVRHGEAIFPGVPIVFCGADSADIAGWVFPPTITGVVLTRTYAPTVDIALQLVPKARNVFVVAGASAFDRRLEEIARRELAPIEKRVAIKYLLGLPMAQLLEAVKRLPPDSIVLYLTVFADRDGRAYLPHDVVRGIAATANAPVFVAIDQYIGTGAVGGHVYSLATQGLEAARMGARILRGESPRDVPLVHAALYQDVFDWRQLERWGLDAQRVPAGSTLAFRSPTLWQQYKAYMALGIAVLLLQTALIVGLLLSRAQRRESEKRRREAEAEARRQKDELAHALRMTTMGELTASIAHELNQPLGAILANVEAAGMLLREDGSSKQALEGALRDTAQAAVRAAETIRRLHTLFRKHEAARETIDVSAVVEDVLALLRSELRMHHVTVRFQPGAAVPPVLGDAVQLRQVVMNLVLNAAEAIDAGGSPGEIVVQTSVTSSGGAAIAVRDTGIGAADADLERMFEHFVTTKPHGLGMGLAISRTILASHGGRIWATRNADRGLTLRVELPAQPEADQRATVSSSSASIITTTSSTS